MICKIHSSMKRLFFVLLSILGFVLISYGTPVKARKTSLRFSAVSDKEVQVTGFKKKVKRQANRKNNVKSVTIPDTVIFRRKPYKVVGVGKFAFASCSTLKKAHVPKDCKIGKDAFPSTCEIEYY